MGIVKSGVSAVGRLLVVITLAITFLAGMFGVFYVQLRGEEIAIPKVVGKNFNDGRDDLTDIGLRIKKIATRYSNEAPNTILEQRPRAGSTAKTGLMISVVVSEKDPDGRSEPAKVKDDETVIGEIKEQPELKIDKQKPKTKKKTSPKTRDVITKKPTPEPGEEPAADGPKTETSKPIDAAKKPEPKPSVKKPVTPVAKPTVNKTPPKIKTATPIPNTRSGDLRNRKATKNN